MDHFSRIPKEVKKIKTQHREINTAIPCPGTMEILEKLDDKESRSMHGQLPIIWNSAIDYNIYDIKKNKFIDFTSAIFFSNVGHSNPEISKMISKMLEKPLLGCYAYGNEIREKYLTKLIEFCGLDLKRPF